MEPLRVTIDVELIEHVLDELEMAGSPRVVFQRDVEKMQAEAEVVSRTNLVRAFTLLMQGIPNLRGRNKCSACGNYIVGVYSYHVCPA